MTRVNLLPNKAKLGLSRLGFVRRLRLTAVILLAIFVLWAGTILAANMYLSAKTKSISSRVAVNKSQLAQFLPKLHLQSRSRTRIKHASKVIANQAGLPLEIEDLYSFLGKEARIKSFDYKLGEAKIVVEAPGLKSLAEFEEKVNRLRADKNIKYELIDAQSVSINDQGAVLLNLKIVPTNVKTK